MVICCGGEARNGGLETLGRPSGGPGISSRKVGKGCKGKQEEERGRVIFIVVEKVNPRVMLT
jgi:hypothetical protein